MHHSKGTMEQQQIAILIASIVLIVLVVLMVSLFLIFQKRKNSLLSHQKESEKKFERTIAQTQIEIREETLRNISWELHDNIGQLLTLAKIQVGVAQEHPERLPDVTETISKSLTELRALSKLINPEAIKSLNLTEALGLEIERFNRMQFIEASIACLGAPSTTIDDKVEIIIFRIFQEFFSNTIKHSKASTLDVTITYTDTQLEIQAKDNGVGFEPHDCTAKQGIGLGNMKSRGNLIGATIALHSEVEKGTALTLIYPYSNSAL